MKKLVPTVFAVALAIALATFAIKRKPTTTAHDFNDHHHSEFRGFVPGSIVLSGTVYVGNADTVTPNEVLPPGCLHTGTITSQIANPDPATVNVPTSDRWHPGCDGPPAAIRAIMAKLRISTTTTTFGTMRAPTPTSAFPRPSFFGTSAPMAICSAL